MDKFIGRGFLQKISFNQAHGTIWVDKDTFRELVMFYLENHLSDRIEVSEFLHENEDAAGNA